MKRVIIALGLLALLAGPVSAQVSVPNTFVTGGRILASEMNANFDALENDSLNRDGGTITGAIVVDPGITIDTIDISAVLGGTGTPTFTSVTSGLFTGPLTGAVTGNVTGNLTGQVSTVSQTSITGIPNLATVGTITSGTWSGSFGAVSGTNLTGLAKLATANTFSAYNKFLTVAETTTSPAIGGGSLTLNLALGTQFAVNLNGNATITLSNPNTNGDGGFFTVVFTNDGTLRTVTWPASVKWASGVVYAPTGTVNKVDTVQCLYNNGGTSYFCAAVLNFF